LTTWLVRKNIPAAFHFFHGRSLSDASVIDSCFRGDYIRESDKHNPDAVRLMVRKFLKNGSSHVKGNRLQNILFLTSKDNPKQSIYLSGELKKISFNQPETDKYYLASLSSVKSLSKPNDDWDEFEKHYDLRNAFVSVTQFRALNEDRRYGDDVVLVLLWVNAGAEWKIVLAADATCSA